MGVSLKAAGPVAELIFNIKIEPKKKSRRLDFEYDYQIPCCYKKSTLFQHNAFFPERLENFPPVNRSADP